MSLKVLRSARARRDLTHHFVFIARDDVDAAHRFLDAYTRAVEQISDFPEIGSLRKLYNPNLRTVRLWSLEGFEKYMLVYHVRAKSILILRVIHAAQDYTRL